jgi:flagellar motor component MotA
MTLFLIAAVVGAGPVIGAALIGLIVGFVLSFVLYSPEKRALARLEEIVKQQEAAVKVTVFKDRSQFTAEFGNGVSHMLTRLRTELSALKNKL